MILSKIMSPFPSSLSLSLSIFSGKLFLFTVVVSVTGRKFCLKQLNGWFFEVKWIDDCNELMCQCQGPFAIYWYGCTRYHLYNNK